MEYEESRRECYNKHIQAFLGKIYIHALLFDFIFLEGSMKCLVDILVDFGFINAAELKDYLGVQKKTGKHIVEIIVESGLMSDEDILRVVSSQYNYPILNLSERYIDPKATALLSQKFCENNVVLPICFDNGNLVIAIDDPANISIDELQLKTGYPISLMIASHFSIINAIKLGDFPWAD